MFLGAGLLVNTQNAKASHGAGAEIIGEVLAEDRQTGPLVVVRSKVGGLRVLPMLAGEQLPRIC